MNGSAHDPRYYVRTAHATGLTITDDDGPAVTLSLSGSPMAEASGTATVTVNLEFGGTATLTSDYTRSGTSITIPAGSASGTVTLTAVQDTLDEVDEIVVVDTLR